MKGLISMTVPLEWLEVKCLGQGHSSDLLFCWVWTSNLVKGIGYPKIFSPSGHPRCWLVCFCIGKDLAFRHLLTNGSSAVNGCRQNESPNSCIKHYSNPHNSNPSIYVLWSEKLHVCKKQTHHLDVLTSNCHFWPKYQSVIYNNASFREKVHSLCPLTSSDIVVLYCFHL